MGMMASRARNCWLQSCFLLLHGDGWYMMEAGEAGPGSSQPPAVVIGATHVCALGPSLAAGEIRFW